MHLLSAKSLSYTVLKLIMPFSQGHSFVFNALAEGKTFSQKVAITNLCGKLD